MAITKILARHFRGDVGIQYVLNGDKTNEQVFTYRMNCVEGREYQQMKLTKEKYGKTDGVQSYHIIQSFRPGEVTPELALEIAKAFAVEHLAGYEAVIGVHVDKEHIHAHTVFNSVRASDGSKYHSNAQSYYGQIRVISDQLCREHGLSVIMEGDTHRSMTYIEWLRKQKGQPTFRAMLAADLRQAIQDANDYGHFLMLMEHMGYEVKHGNRLSFRLRGLERWMVPSREDTLFTEEGIRKAIEANLDAIEAGIKPTIIQRPRYVPYKKHLKYTGFMALYVHYLYLLGKIEKREYPPRMTPHLKAELIKFDRYKAQFTLLREHGISGPEQLAAHRKECESRLAALVKQRTILNTRKKQRKPIYDALAASESLRPAMELYMQGISGMEEEAAQYMAAEDLLKKAGVPREQLMQEKAEAYEAVAEINRQMRAIRKEVALCDEIHTLAPIMEKHIRSTEKVRAEKRSISKEKQHIPDESR